MLSGDEPVILPRDSDEIQMVSAHNFVARQGLACIMTMAYYTWYHHGDETGTAPVVGSEQCTGPRRRWYTSGRPVGCFVPSEWVLYRRLAAASTARQHTCMEAPGRAVRTDCAVPRDRLARRKQLYCRPAIRPKSAIARHVACH